MYNDVDLISETYEDIASGKLQIRRLQPPHSYLRNAFECLEKIYIARN